MIIKKKYLQSSIISENKSLNQVLITLQKSDLPDKKICLVTKKNKLVGVFTDGDMRRLLIKNVNRNEKLKKYLKKKLIFAYTNFDENKLKKIIKDKHIVGVPIIKKNRELVGLYTPKEDFYKRDNEVFIFAGGFGKRLFPLTDYNPKPMLSVGGRPLLESIIYSFKEFGFINFTISVNYKASKIIDYFKKGKEHNVAIKYLKEKNPLGTAGPLSNFKNKNKKTVIAINGDIYTRLDYRKLLNFHERGKYDFTICIKDYHQRIPYGVINSKKNKKKNIIDEKPVSHFFVNSGVFAFDPKVLKFLKKNQHLDMNNFINMLSKKGKKIGLFPLHEYWIDIGNYENFETAFNQLRND